MKDKSQYIADRIRLMISTKQFEVGETLPSTRELGKQLDTSFHTVRKAYQQLAENGLIKARKGSGYIVQKQTASLDKEQRLELGASKIRTLVEELMGYGLSNDEIEALFEEQLDFIELPSRIQSVATVAQNMEIGQMLSRAIRAQVGVKSKVMLVHEIEKAVNFDALFVPLEHINFFKNAYEDVLLIPIIFHFDPDCLIELMKYPSTEQFSLVSRDPNTPPVLLNMLKKTVPIPSSVVGGALENRRIPYQLKEVDRVLYTTESAAFVEALIPERKRILLKFIISDYSTDLIRGELWEN
jgi:DNA-binding transcriptional regulator YhcF (GntR family)